MEKQSLPSSPIVGKRIAKNLKTIKKLNEVNNIITCYLCRGYLIEPTAINECLHLYCRSCIVKHLENFKFCPKCNDPKRIISLQHLRLDLTMRALIYKLVPGLYHKENERIEQFYMSSGVEHINSDQLDDNFFDKTDLFSLSLKYYTKLTNNNIRSHMHTVNVLPTIYLECPAMITVNHLRRFLNIKFDVQSNYSINIIYDNEILPHDSTIMDVAYCYKWKRLSPLEFYYYIIETSIDCFKYEAVEKVKTKFETNKLLDNELQDVNKIANSDNLLMERIKISQTNILHNSKSNGSVVEGNKCTRKIELNEENISNGNNHRLNLDNDFKSLRSNDVKNFVSTPTNITSNKIITTKDITKISLKESSSSKSCKVTDCVHKADISASVNIIDNKLLSVNSTINSKEQNIKKRNSNDANLEPMSDGAKKKLLIESKNYDVDGNTQLSSSARKQRDNENSITVDVAVNKNKNLESIESTNIQVDKTEYIKHIGLKPIKINDSMGKTNDTHKKSRTDGNNININRLKSHKSIAVEPNNDNSKLNMKITQLTKQNELNDKKKLRNKSVSSKTDRPAVSFKCDIIVKEADSPKHVTIPDSNSIKEIKGILRKPIDKNRNQLTLKQQTIPEIKPIQHKITEEKIQGKKRTKSMDTTYHLPSKISKDTSHRFTYPLPNAPGLVKFSSFKPDIQPMRNIPKSLSNNVSLQRPSISKTKIPYTRIDQNNDNLIMKPIPMLLASSEAKTTKPSNMNNDSQQTDKCPPADTVRITNAISNAEQQQLIDTHFNKNQLDQLEEIEINNIFNINKVNDKERHTSSCKSMRPPPATIPLVKIRKDGNNLKNNVNRQILPNNLDKQTPLDLSGKSSRSATLDTRPSQSRAPTIISSPLLRPLAMPRMKNLPKLTKISKDSIIYRDNDHALNKKNSPKTYEKNNNMIHPTIQVQQDKKHEKINETRKYNKIATSSNAVNTIQSSSFTIRALTDQMTNSTMPKLAEISNQKSSSSSMCAQFNTAFRNIPNPSILALRAAQQRNSNESKNTISNISTSSATTMLSIVGVRDSTGGKRSPPMLVPNTMSFRLDNKKKIIENNVGKTNMLMNDEKKTFADRKNIHIEQLAANLRASVTAVDETLPSKVTVTKN